MTGAGRLSRRALVGGAAGAALTGTTLSELQGDASAQGRPDATVTWGEDQDYATLDPRVTQSRHEAQAIMQMFESLLFLDTDGKFYPWLAQRWEYSKDGTSITFHLRRDVKFHDGTPFNGDAVKFTFDTVVDPTLGSQGAIDFLGPYKSTDVIDQYTVRVNWTEPFAAALTNLSNPWLCSIVSPTAVRKLGNDGFARNPVGTGPFKFVEWVPRVRVVMERNEEYRWAPPVFNRQAPSALKRLVIRIIPDASTRVAALEKGEIDVCDQVPPIEVKRFQGSREGGRDQAQRRDGNEGQTGRDGHARPVQHRRDPMGRRRPERARHPLLLPQHSRAWQIQVQLVAVRLAGTRSHPATGRRADRCQTATAGPRPDPEIRAGPRAYVPGPCEHTVRRLPPGRAQPQVRAGVLAGAVLRGDGFLSGRSATAGDPRPSRRGLPAPSPRLMLRYLLRRLLWAVPVLLTATTCAFLVLHLIPGDPVNLMLSGR